ACLLFSTRLHRAGRTIPSIRPWAVRLDFPPAQSELGPRPGIYSLTRGTHDRYQSVFVRTRRDRGLGGGSGAGGFLGAVVRALQAAGAAARATGTRVRRAVPPRERELRHQPRAGEL